MDRYRSMETALAQQVARNHQLDEDLQELCTSASPFVEYVQARYNLLRVKYDERVNHAFREALAVRVDQTDLIEHLQSKLLQDVRTHHATQEKSNREIARTRKQMYDVGHRLVVECDKLSDSLRKAKDKKSQYKNFGIHIQGKLRRALRRVEGLGPGT